MPIHRAMMLAMLLLAGSALAQPAQKPIQLIVPFAPGGSADGIARIIAAELGARLNRQVVVENKGGAAGSLGLQLLAKAAPDGDTLAVGASGALVINPNIPNSGTFDPLRELAAVAKLIEIPIVLVANPNVGPKSIREMIDRSKATAGGMSFGTTGVNSSQHLTIEVLKKVTGANLVHVPYRGSAPAVTDVLGGQIPLASVDLTSAHAHTKAGALIALGVPQGKRAAIAPEIPTIAEGGVPGFAWAPSFIGLLAPAATPPDVVKRISRAIADILTKPDVQAKVRLLSVEPVYEDDVTFANFLKAESARWKEALSAMSLAQ